MPTAPLTLGIEEEYQIIDPQSRELTSYVQQMMNHGTVVLGHQLKPEFMQSQIEVGSQICQNIHEARQEIVRLRRSVSEVAAQAGAVIISGMAAGIDTAAHMGALGSDRPTVAVLGCGTDICYPKSNRRLYEDIMAYGALLSEYPPGVPPLAEHFPRRNRIMSGLSLGVVVVEAGPRSGALITARLAYEQGREVFAVPGRVDSRPSRGCHRLLRDGATLVESIDDVLEQLGPLFEAAPREDGTEIRHPAELNLNEIERAVLDAIDSEATAVDQLITATGLPVNQVLSTISVLEMRRLIRRLSGSTVVRV